MRHVIATIILLFTVSLSSNPYDIVCPFEEEWKQLTDSAVATVYHACKQEGNQDYLHTASMYKVIPSQVEQQRILAMERTMMTRYDIRYGDIVLIEGTGDFDGLWQVQDTMNKRFAGQEKIDLLVPKSIKYGKWENVKISIPGNAFTKHIRKI